MIPLNSTTDAPTDRGEDSCPYLNIKHAITVNQVLNQTTDDRPCLIVRVCLKDSMVEMSNFNSEPSKYPGLNLRMTKKYTNIAQQT